MTDPAEDTTESVSDEDGIQEEAPEQTIPETMKAPLLEAILFANGEPIGLGRLKEVSGIRKDAEIREVLESIKMKFELEDSGIELVSFSGKYQLRTKGQFGTYLQKLKSGRPRRLSHAALETLAVVAYRQPIVKSDIEKIRGVDATPTLKTLVERSLVKIVGHKATVGQPALYGTTEKFLSIFGLGALSELPTLQELQELEEDPGEPEEELGSDESVEASETPILESPISESQASV